MLGAVAGGGGLFLFVPRDRGAWSRLCPSDSPPSSPLALRAVQSLRHLCLPIPTPPPLPFVLHWSPEQLSSCKYHRTLSSLKLDGSNDFSIKVEEAGLRKIHDAQGTEKAELFVVNMTSSKRAWGGSRGLWGRVPPTPSPARPASAPGVGVSWGGGDVSDETSSCKCIEMRLWGRFDKLPSGTKAL